MLGHFVLVFIFPAIERCLPKSRWAPTSLHISYQERRGALREILAACTGQDFSVSRVQVERAPTHSRGESSGQAGKGRGTDWEDHPVETEEAPLADSPLQGIVTLMIEVRGAKSVPRLATRLSEIAGVTLVRVDDGNVSD
jgi:hypothetical protein